MTSYNRKRRDEHHHTDRMTHLREVVTTDMAVEIGVIGGEVTTNVCDFFRSFEWAAVRELALRDSCFRL